MDFSSINFDTSWKSFGCFLASWVIYNEDVLPIICWSVPSFICSNSPVLNGRLPFWKDTSHPPGPSWNLPFWDDPGLNVRYLWIFQVDHTFYKLDMEILTANNEIRCVRCSHPPSSSSALDPCQEKHLLFWH